jgi:Secretion system C-terminal sorting domain
MKRKLQSLVLALVILIPALSIAQNDATSTIARYNEGITAPVKEITFRQSARAMPNFFNSTENDLPVYPIPATSTIRVVMNELAPGDIHADVLDLNGNVVRTYKYVSGSDLLEVNISGLPGGIYSVRVYGKDIASHNLKIVKQ